MRLTIRIVVVLPQPDGPDQHADLARREPRATAPRRRRLGAGIALGRLAELERRGLRAGGRPLGLGSGGVHLTAGLLAEGRKNPTDSHCRRPGRRARVRGVLERVVQRSELGRIAAQRGGRRASRRTTRSSAAAGRGGRCPARCRGRRRGRPRSRRAPLLPWPFSTRPSGCAPARDACARRGSRSRRAPAGRRRGRPRWRRCRSAAGRDRARSRRSTRPDAREPLAAQLVGVAEQLVAAADREDDAPRARRRRAARRA